jgi:hypothetical protein
VFKAKEKKSRYSDGKELIGLVTGKRPPITGRKQLGCSS